MEAILDLYKQPYDAAYPVLCFDERPCFLIESGLPVLPMQAGKVKKEHYSYKKKGSCDLLAAIEPLSGKRFARVNKQRTKKEYAQFMKHLAANYAEAKKIRLVQDNLNTHDISAFYENFPADEAFELAQKFEFYYTPKSASWLNMIEIEFSALARQALHRRIPTMKELKREVMALVKERNEKQIKINWQFSIQSSRKKLNRHYQKVNSANEKFKNKNED